MSIKKIKPEFETKKYPLQYAECCFKHFNIKELNKVDINDKKLRDFLFKYFPDFKISFDILNHYYTYTDLKDFINHYISQREKNSISEDKYKNNQEIKRIPISIDSKQKNK